MEVLSELDARLLDRLRTGDIRLLRTSWLVQRGSCSRIMRRQELEALEREGASPSPLLSPDEAFELVSQADRSVGALTYGWLKHGNPDPEGERLAVVRQTLADHPRIEALFWE